MSRFFIAALAFGLAACGVEGATELGGVASYAVSPSSAVADANAHCQKYGRIARVTQIEAWRGYIAFSCDKP